MGTCECFAARTEHTRLSEDDLKKKAKLVGGYQASEAQLCVMVGLLRRRILYCPRCGVQEIHYAWACQDMPAGAVEVRKSNHEVVNALEQLDGLHAKRIRQWKTPSVLRPPAQPKDNSVMP